MSRFNMLDFGQNSTEDIAGIGNNSNFLGQDLKSTNSNFDFISTPGVDAGLGKSTQGGGFMDGFLTDGKGGSGWGMDVFNMAKGAFDVYGKMKQLNLAEDSLDFQKDSFNSQFAIQKKMTQADLDWRRKSRNDRLAGSGGERVVL